MYLFALPASPVPGIDHYGDDDLPTIPEEIVTDELPSEVHTRRLSVFGGLDISFHTLSIVTYSYL